MGWPEVNAYVSYIHGRDLVIPATSMPTPLKRNWTILNHYLKLLLHCGVLRKTALGRHANMLLVKTYLLGFLDSFLLYFLVWLGTREIHFRYREGTGTRDLGKGGKKSFHKIFKIQNGISKFSKWFQVVEMLLSSSRP